MTTRSATASASPRPRPGDLDVEDLRLNYDPERPQERFKSAGVAAALRSTSERLPAPPPWPEAAKPVAAPLPKAPAETDDLSRFKGKIDAVVVTWTAAEAAALAALFTPGYPAASWYEYRHDIAAYAPLVTGGRAPFNDRQPDMARYYRSLGLYFPCQIGKARVLLFKSGLHLDYDGPATPVRKLIDELAGMIEPTVFVTTGTGGGIGKDVALGDVILAPQTRFYCTTQFKNAPFASAVHKTSPLPARTLAAITPALIEVNAARVQRGGGRATPKFWTAADADIVTTDFFGFDDSTDYYKLQGRGLACDMGDAMVGDALQAHQNIAWYAIRNASDPQIPNPSHDIKAANHEAGLIYSEYGAFTTAASVIATWAVITATFNK